jgi:hypothetical protein
MFSLGRFAMQTQVLEASLTASLSNGLPEEVAALGKPEHVYPVDDRKVWRNGILLQITVLLVALCMFGLAGMTGFAIVKPFGTNMPDKTVLLGISLGSGGLGLVLVAFACWFTTDRLAASIMGFEILFDLP